MYPPAIAHDAPDKVAYIMAASGEQITYGRLDEQSNRLAHHWRANGVSAGDSVVLAMENGLAWPVAVAAGMRSGVYVTPVNWHLKPDELAVLLADIAPAAIVTSAALAEHVAEAIAASALPPPNVLCADGRAAGFAALDEAITAMPTTPIADESLGARVLYSSGTTGRPKRFAQRLLGVHPADAPRRHSDLVDRLQVDADTVLLSPAPNYHAAPFTFALITLSAGGTVVCMERFDARAALQTIVDYSVTHSQWVPTMLIRMLRLPERDAIELAPTHRVAFTSGAPCPAHVKNDIIDWWGPILHEYYGASEGYGHTYVSPDEALTHPGTVGRPLGSARVRIVDRDGTCVPTGIEGTVCFEASGATPYRNDDSDSAPALKEMGDLGRLDENGYLYLVGRCGFTIISGGVNIYPDEIESALLSHPGIADVAVIGVPDDEFGESVKAVVRLQPGSTITADDVIAHARDRLAHFKAPRTVEFTEDLPRLPTGKLDKHSLVRRFTRRETP